eukprot:2665491-Rhodomonas_salina.1
MSTHLRAGPSSGPSHTLCATTLGLSALSFVACGRSSFFSPSPPLSFCAPPTPSHTLPPPSSTSTWTQTGSARS